MLETESDPESGFEAAVAWFRARVPLTSEQWAQLTADVRTRAFTVAGVAQLDVVADTWRALDQAIAGGSTLADFKAAVGGQLAAAWGGEDAARLETIFRTNVQMAYGAGRYSQQNDPVVKDARPYWRFSAVLDSRTSRICGPLHGTTLPADDEFWGTHQPPLHMNCRSTVMALTDEQAKSMGITTEVPAVEPQEGFGDPLALFEPDLDSKPPQLVAAYQAKGGAGGGGSGGGGGAGGVGGGGAGGPPKREPTKAEIAKILASPRFDAFISGADERDLPLAVVEEDLAAEIDASTRMVLLSQETLKKNRARHPEVPGELWRSVQQIIDDAHLVVKDGQKTLVFVRRGQQHLHLVVKSTKSGEGMFATSLRYSSEKDELRVRRKGRIIRAR